MALVPALTVVSGYATGDLELSVATLPGWAMSGLVEPETNWLLCNGAIMPDDTRHHALFTLVGTNFGPVAGTLPTLINGVQPAARGGSVLTTLGANRGAATVTLLLANLTPHVHTHVDWFPTDPTITNNGMGNADAAGSHVFTRNFSSVGGGGSHNNLSPYFVVEGMLVRL